MHSEPLCKQSYGEVNIMMTSVPCHAFSFAVLQQCLVANAIISCVEQVQSHFASPIEYWKQVRIEN